MKKLLLILACPACQGDLRVCGNKLLCRACARTFTLKEKTPLLLLKEKLTSRKQEEVTAFNDLAAYQELMSRPYFKDLKDKIRNTLKNYNFKGKTILEIGAGTSLFLDLFKKNNLLIASDINFTLLRQNQAKAQLVVADAEYLPFKDHVFDFVYLVGLLHHLEDQKKALEEIKRVLKRKGTVFMSEPTQWSLNLVYYLARQLFLKILGPVRLKRWIGCGTPYESFVSLKAVKQALGKDFCLRFRKILPLRLPPLKVLEGLSVKRVNGFLEKTPLIRNLGTIIFIEARGRRKGK